MQCRSPLVLERWSIPAPAAFRHWYRQPHSGGDVLAHHVAILMLKDVAVEHEGVFARRLSCMIGSQGFFEKHGILTDEQMGPLPRPMIPVASILPAPCRIPRRLNILHSLNTTDETMLHGLGLRHEQLICRRKVRGREGLRRCRCLYRQLFLGNGMRFLRIEIPIGVLAGKSFKRSTIARLSNSAWRVRDCPQSLSCAFSASVRKS